MDTDSASSHERFWLEPAVNDAIYDALELRILRHECWSCDTRMVLIGKLFDETLWNCPGCGDQCSETWR